MKHRDDPWPLIPADPLFLPVTTIILAMFLFGQIKEWLHERWVWSFWLALACSVAGAVFLIRAKLPLYRQKIFFAIGPRGIPQSLRKFYWLGVKLSCLGIILMVILLSISLNWSQASE